MVQCRSNSCNARLYCIRNWEPIYFWRWIALMWERGGRPKRRRMHLFCAAWSLCFRFLLSRERHDVQLQSKWSWIKTLRSNLFNPGVKYLFYLRRSLIFALNFLKTFIATDSPLRLKSRWHPKYSTVWYCLII